MSTVDKGSAEPKVKGVAFRSVLASLVEIGGEPVLERTLARLSNEEQDMLRYKIVQTGWYPISLYRTMWKAILAETGGGTEIVRKIGALAIRRDINGVYRMIFKVLSPETVFSLSGKLFNTYYDTGTLTIPEKHHGFARAVYEGCRGFDRTMWEELVGSGVELFTLAGGKNAKMTIVRGGQDGSGNCEMVAEWT